MTFVAEVSYKGTIDVAKGKEIEELAKQFRGEWIYSGTDTPKKGKQQRREIGFEFETKGKALGFLKTVKKNIKGLGRMFVRESDG